LAIDKNGFLYVTGNVLSETGIATQGAFKTMFDNHGVNDCMIAKFSDLCFDRYEPNNSKNVPSHLNVPFENMLTVNGQIDTLGDKDYYSFSNSAAYPNMKIMLTNLPANYDLYLYGITGQKIEQSTSNGKKKEVVVHNSTDTGVYMIKVMGRGTMAFND